MEDVTKLTKEEFLRFLNCSLHSTKPERIYVPGPKNSVISLVKRAGKYKACNVELQETSINNQIVRVPLPVVDLQSFTPRQVAYKFRNQLTEKRRRKNNAVVSRFGRRLKKKPFHFPTSKIYARSQNSFRYITRNQTRNILTQPEEKKVYLQKMNVAKPAVQPNPMQFQNNKIIRPKPQFIIKYVPSEPTYFLTFSKLRHPEDGKLCYSFDALVKDIKNMKLPSPTWKIKVVVRNNKISSIIFTNKCVLERTVTFNAKSDRFQIVIENKPAILLGSPSIVNCIEDIEILLNIIHTISAKNPMVYYKN